MSRNLLSYLSGVILELSLENRPLWVVVILKHLAPDLIFWKDRSVLSSSFSLSKCNLLYHINYQRVEGGFILTLHSVLLGDSFTQARAELLREINLIISPVLQEHKQDHFSGSGEPVLCLVGRANLALNTSPEKAFQTPASSPSQPGFSCGSVQPPTSHFSPGCCLFSLALSTFLFPLLRPGKNKACSHLVSY